MLSLSFSFFNVCGIRRISWQSRESLVCVFPHFVSEKSRRDLYESEKQKYVVNSVIKRVRDLFLVKIYHKKLDISFLFYFFARNTQLKTTQYKIACRLRDVEFYWHFCKINFIQNQLIHVNGYLKFFRFSLFFHAFLFDIFIKISNIYASYCVFLHRVLIKYASSKLGREGLREKCKSFIYEPFMNISQV